MKTFDDFLNDLVVVESANAKKDVIDFLKRLEKDIPSAIKELETDTFGGAKSVTPGLIGKMIRIDGEKWYHQLFK